METQEDFHRIDLNLDCWVDPPPSDTIQKVMMKQFDVVEGAETRLWMKSSDTYCERLRNVHVNVLDSSLSSGMVCLLSLSDPHPTLHLPSCIPLLLPEIQ
jgi:hypothetical protein